MFPGGKMNTMKILYIHQYFKIPEEGGCIRSYYLAKGLVDHGHEVEMITAHNGKKYAKRQVAGINVHYLPVFYDNRLNFSGRIFSFLKFSFQAIRIAGRLRNIDVCYAMSTPLTVGVIALYLKKKYRIPYYFEVGDLWPEAPVQMGVIRNYVVKEALYGFERKVYREADKLVALSPDIGNAMLKVSGKSHVTIIPNMADCDFFTPAIRDPALESRYAVRNRFVITYFGAIGRANHLEYLIAAAAACQAEGLAVFFLVIGQGSELNRIRQLSKEQSLSNITFLPHQNKEHLRSLLSITDAVYISYASIPVLQTGSPNKFFDGLAAGKAIITNTEGWIKDLITSHACGFYYDPGCPGRLVEKLRPYLQGPALLLKHQKNARELGQQYFSRELQVQKLLKVFDNGYKMKVRGAQVYTLTA